MKFLKSKFFRVIVMLIAVSFLATQTGILDNILRPKTAYAVGDLDVIWGVPDGDPIFVVENMLPGDSEQRTVTVKNNASSAREVSIKGIKTDEAKNFSQILDFVISQNGIDIYGGTSPTGPKTLAQFFLDSNTPTGLALSTVPAGGQNQYVFKAYFPTSAGNEYQGARVVFDLVIRLAFDVPAACSHIEFDGEPIFGTQKGDKIKGTNGNDLIFGLEGGDAIDGKNGDDCIVGGTHGDSLKGGNGNDVIIGGTGGDAIDGGNGNDLMYGNEDSDSLDGGNGNDKGWGGTGHDALKGGAGNDELHGEDGSDTANGGPNTDICTAEVRTQCEL